MVLKNCSNYILSLLKLNLKSFFFKDLLQKNIVLENLYNDD